MARGTSTLALLAAGLLFGSSAPAQAPPACEDQVRTFRLLADQLTRSRQRGELEAAQVTGALATRIDALEAELARLKAEAAKPKPLEQK